LKKLLGIKSVSSPSYSSPTKRRISYPQDQFLDVGEIDEKFDRTYKAHSRSQKDVIYMVNVKKLSCTCPDFVKNRSHYAERDVRRVCAHIYDKLYQTKVEKNFNPLLQLIIRYARKERNFHKLKTDNGDFVFGFSKNSPWIKVIAIISNTPQIGSFNILEDRWAYDEEPECLEEIKGQILKLFCG
jgi:hypothetical protein